jgi:hypothetical protein
MKIKREIYKSSIKSYFYQIQSLIDIQSSNPCPISTLQTQSKTKTTLNNRLKKHAKQNCHYNYFSIYIISLFSIFFLLNKFESKIKYDIEWCSKSKIQNGWAVDAFKQFLCRFPCSILCLIFKICAAYKLIFLLMSVGADLMSGHWFESIYMINSDQRQDSNRRPLLKSASTDVIISNHGPI